MRLRFFALVFLLLQIILAGCSTVQEAGDSALRDTAVKTYRYQELRDELIVEPLKLSPGVVSPGDMMSVELKFAVLSPQKEKRFKVLEILTLSAADVRIQILRQELERQQGLHVSMHRILVPKDIPPGDYTLVATVSAEDQQVTKRAGFLVKK